MTDFLKNPLVCNTGVQSYIVPNQKISYSIDWLRFTTGEIEFGLDGEPKNTSIPVINKLLNKLKSEFNYFDLELVPGGFYGYKFRMEVAEGITIFFNGSVNKYGQPTTMVEITGAGCDYFTTIEDWFELISFILSDEYNGKATRFDEAIDDYYGEHIKSKYFFDLIKDGFFKRAGSPKTKIKWVINDHKDYDKGCTVYFYSNSSDMQLAVYNKMAEVKEKKDKETLTPQWMRYEMRFFDDQSDSQLLNFYNCLLKEKFNLSSCSSIASLLSSSLYELLKLFKPTKDTNKQRWVELPEWIDFIGDISSVKFERHVNHISSILKTKEYFENNYAKFLLKMYLVFGFDYEKLWLSDFMYKKRASLEAKDIVSINSLRRQLGIKRLKKSEIAILLSKLEISEEDDLNVLKQFNIEGIHDESK